MKLNLARSFGASDTLPLSKPPVPLPLGGPETVRRIIRAYDDARVRAYCWARFKILRQRFLDEIGQYLPAAGPVLDIGCGFGLFSLYYAVSGPERELRGIDLNRGRLEMARRAAAQLDIPNVEYAFGDAAEFRAHERYDAAYMLDVVHHIPTDAVEPLLHQLARSLVTGGVLLIKDVDARPAYKRWFTWALDKAMSPPTPVRYWPAEDITRLLRRLGFRVYRHAMVDFLPYPHVLYICHKLA
jgi:SAM-dependent methyltransferase